MEGKIEYRQVDRRSELSLREFNREYRNRGKPVVLLNAFEQWRARSAWTFDFFKTRYGKTEVRVYHYQGDRYEPDKVKQMSLSDYIDGILSNEWGSFPYYIRDNWALLYEHPELSTDYQLPEYFFDWYSILPRFLRLPYPRIFIGPKGAVTPLHQDIWGTHAWLAQLVGSKRWLLYSPDQRNLMYDFQVQPENPDFGRFPLFRQARPLECIVGPGEMVFVPSGWIHYVVSLDPTISLSSNYMGPGCFWPGTTNAVKELLLKRGWNVSTQWIARLAPRTGGTQ